MSNANSLWTIINIICNNGSRRHTKNDSHIRRCPSTTIMISVTHVLQQSFEHSARRRYARSILHSSSLQRPHRDLRISQADTRLREHVRCLENVPEQRISTRQVVVWLKYWLYSTHHIMPSRINLERVIVSAEAKIFVDSLPTGTSIDGVCFSRSFRVVFSSSSCGLYI